MLLAKAWLVVGSLMVVVCGVTPLTTAHPLHSLHRDNTHIFIPLQIIQVGQRLIEILFLNNLIRSPTVDGL